MVENKNLKLKINEKIEGIEGLLKYKVFSLEGVQTELYQKPPGKPQNLII